MELTIKVSMSDLGSLVEQLDDEEIDQLITKLAERIKPSIKALRVRWDSGLQIDTVYDFNSTIEYEAFLACLEEIDPQISSIPSEYDNESAFMTTTRKRCL